MIKQNGERESKVGIQRSVVFSTPSATSNVTYPCWAQDPRALPTCDTLIEALG